MTPHVADRHSDGLDSDFTGFHSLLPCRVQDVLLVCSLYESFILEEDGLVADLISSEYLEMNLSHAPRVSRASTGQEAMRLIQERGFDLVITMTRLADWNVQEFAQAVKRIKPELRVVILADDPAPVRLDGREVGAVAAPWWIMIAEAPTAPRFGFDQDERESAPDVPDDAATRDDDWNWVSWQDVLPEGRGHVHVAGVAAAVSGRLSAGAAARSIPAALSSAAIAIAPAMSAMVWAPSQRLRTAAAVPFNISPRSG